MINGTVNEAVKFRIAANFSVDTKEYANKQDALGALGKHIDEFTNYYGGLITDIKLHYNNNSTSKSMDAEKPNFVDIITVEVEANGIRMRL